MLWFKSLIVSLERALSKGRSVVPVDPERLAVRVAGFQTRELASAPLPAGTSTLRAAIAIEDGDRHQRCSTGCGGTFRLESGERPRTLESEPNAIDGFPGRVWLDARGGVVRVMAQATQESPVFFRFDGIYDETRVA